MTSVSVIGGSGYIGGEVLRLLCSREDIEIIQITSSSMEGRYVHSAHPNLRGTLDMRFSPPEKLQDADVIFSALPHGKSMENMRKLMDHTDHVIDLSADFRLNDEGTFREHYGMDHAEPDLMREFPYGIPELNREQIRKKGLCAAPGCVASSLILGLYPFRDIRGDVIADVKIGSSASGRGHSSSTHHPERSGTIRPYAPVDHRHRAEVFQETGIDPMMTVHAVEMVRGIFSTIHVRLDDTLEQKDVWRRLRESYGEERFIRTVRSGKGLFRYPDPKFLAGTNFCDIGFELDERRNRLVIFSALDNLVKGGGGAAVQSMNIILGCEEHRGLEFPGLHPI